MDDIFEEASPSAPPSAPQHPYDPNFDPDLARSLFEEMTRNLGKRVDKNNPYSDLTNALPPTMDATICTDLTQRYNDLVSQMEDIQKQFVALGKEVVTKKTSEWSIYFSQFQKGEWAYDTSSKEYGIVNNFDFTWGAIFLKCLKPLKSSQLQESSGHSPKNVIPSHKFSEEQKNQLKSLQDKAKKFEAIYSSGHVDSCPKCSHKYCASYHCCDIREMSGWEMICIDARCECSACKNKRKDQEYYCGFGCCICDLRRGDCERHSDCGH